MLNCNAKCATGGAAEVWVVQIFEAHQFCKLTTKNGLIKLKRFFVSSIEVKVLVNCCQG
jgi:hypothetical protein